MKILIPVKSGTGLDAELDGRFGRGAFFLVYDTGEDKVVSVETNPYKDLDHGAGVKTALHVVDEECNVVIGPQTGPKLSAILEEAHVDMVVRETGTAAEAVAWYKNGMGR